MKSKAILGIIVAIAALFAMYLLWEWGFCRFYVGPDHMAIVTAKDGKDLPSGQILADRGQKGIWREPLGEGRHFLNPVSYEWKIVPVISIPPGKVGIVTAKDGKDLKPGEFLAKEGEKGIWKDVLGPGKYRLNPEGFDVTLADAINIPIGYVGVVTSLSGTKASDGQFALPGQKGVMHDILQPGLYYINQNAYKVDVLEIGLNQVSLTGKEGGQVLTKSKMEVQNAAMEQLASNVLAQQMQRRKDYLEKEQAEEKSFSSRSRSVVVGKTKKQEATKVAKKISLLSNDMSTFGLEQVVEFPSRDGFEIQLDMTVEFELQPGKIAEIMMKYGDLPAVVDKIIMPQIQSVSRLKGSSYRAQDFILGEGREKFQNDLKEALAAVLGKKDIVIHNSLIRRVDVPEQILVPIQDASLAVEQNLTNIARQNTARKQAELNTEESLIEQRRQQVMQETEKLVAEIKAQQEKSVAEIQANTELNVAQIAQQTANVRADVTRTIGQANATITSMIEGEKSRGFQLKVNAGGGPEAYNLLIFSEELNPELQMQVIHAGEGTLWTDLKNLGFGELGGAKILSSKKKSLHPMQ
ncbi:MAG: SPFH domain-containing protein [Victivallaceae bacterium]